MRGVPKVDKTGAQLAAAFFRELDKSMKAEGIRKFKKSAKWDPRFGEWIRTFDPIVTDVDVIDAAAILRSILEDACAAGALLRLSKRR